MRIIDRTYQSLIVLFELIFLVMCLQACQGQPNSAISGTIELAEDWKSKVYIVKPNHFNEIAGNYLGEIIDSLELDPDGSFSFSKPEWLTEEKLALLVVQKKGERFANHLQDENPNEANYMPIVISPSESIAIEAEIAAFQKSFVFKNPSAENKAIASLRDIRIEAYKHLQSALEKDTHDDAFIIEREEAHHQYTKSMRDFASNTSEYYAGLLAIRWVSPTGDFERYPEFIHAQCEQWKTKKPDHLFTQELCALADKNQLPVMVGDLIPDFELPMMSGDTTSLYQLLGTRLTILDIWASWCAPCRKENRNVLAPLYATYQDKGLNIIGYALDSGEGPWKAAIEKDSAIWDHASHLQGDQSPFMDVLRISTIPANYILDGDGKILAKNLHGEELTLFIQDQIESY